MGDPTGEGFDRRKGPSLFELARDLSAGRISRAELVQQSLDAIEQADGQGRTAFIRVADDALDIAQQFDRHPPELRYAGVPISVKDLFDIQGQVTTAGSVLLRDQAPAKQDAAVVRSLRMLVL